MLQVLCGQGAANLQRPTYNCISALLYHLRFSMAIERLQKIIAAAGIVSRRHAEEIIQHGRVSVNGQIVSELGSKADPERDHIRVDGKLLHVSERHVYLVVNKPKGYVTTVTDPERRPTIMDLVRQVSTRVYPVGRLDFNSEGLLLLTNDGALAARLMHASSHLPKTYVVKVSGQPTSEAIERLRRGITLPPEPRPGKKPPRDAKPVKTAPAKIRLVREAENPWYEVTLMEGRNRQIRRMFEQVGHHVEKIRRVRYGPLELDVEPGKYRELTRSEVERLKAAVRTSPSSTKSRQKDGATTRKTA
jgi:23S rRNA pseudouridine2605 synthase